MAVNAAPAPCRLMVIIDRQLTCYALSMARKRTVRPPRTPAGSQTAASLIDWREPERNADVLDWRRRAHEFGLRATDDPEDTTAHSAEPPD